MTHPGWEVRLLTPPTYWRCEPGWSWHSRPLPDFLLWCVFDGVGRMTLDGRRCDLRPGTCVVFAPGDAPVAEHDPRRRLLVFGVHFAVESGAEPVAPPDRWLDVRDRELIASIARRCDSGYRRGDPLGLRQARLGLEHILCLLWEDALHPPAGRVDAVLEQLAGAIRQDPGRRWTVAELAAAAALSRAQFTRRFTAYTGQPPIRYLTQARIDRARHLLTEGGLSAAEAARALGYSDLGFFSRQFKRYAGLSPRLASSRRPG